MFRILTAPILFVGLALGLLLVPTASRADDSSIGPYKEKCTEISTAQNGSVKATCKDFFGRAANDVMSAEEVSSCPNQSLPGGPKGAIWNVDGKLRCVLSSTNSPNGHGDILDIISKTESEDSSGKTIHWRIDHPNVSRGTTQYSGIVFDAGDNVKVSAGGCVHTNAGFPGQRWRRYIDPSLTPQEVTDEPFNLYGVYYAGGLYIGPGKDGVPPGRDQPFDVVLSQQPPNGRLLAGSGSSTYPKQSILFLLYYDNAFDDNGYYSYDTGTNDQCKNDGPAWAGVSVFTPKVPVAYSHFGDHKNFDLVWRTDKDGIDDNGVPLNPLWSFQVENPGQVPDFQKSCVVTKDIVGAGPLPPTLQVLSLDSEHCTSQEPVKNPYNSLLGGSVGICNTSETVYGGHINWRVVTYEGGLFYRPWSGPPPEGDDDINLGLETDYQSGQTTELEAPDDGIGVEFKNGETTANYHTKFWNAFHDNATSTYQLISENGDNPVQFADGEYGIVTGLMGIDGVHKGYSELHPVFIIAIEVAWNFSDDGGADETWAFFVRNQGNEGTCSSHTYNWPSNIGDWTYALELPWPDGAKSVRVLTTPFSQLETSGPGQQYLGIESMKPWTILRFKLPAYTATGIDGEITLHYDGAAIRSSKNSRKINPPRRTSTVKRAAGPSGEGELGVDWAEMGARIADPAVRKKFLSELTEAFQANTSAQAQGSAVAPIDEKQTTFTHSQSIGVWTGKPGAVVEQPDAEKQKMSDAVMAVLARYSAALNLPQAELKK